ncbi:hypothetical protein [Nocardia sp. NPDC060259]
MHCRETALYWRYRVEAAWRRRAARSQRSGVDRILSGRAHLTQRW